MFLLSSHNSAGLPQTMCCALPLNDHHDHISNWGKLKPYFCSRKCVRVCVSDDSLLIAVTNAEWHLRHLALYNSWTEFRKIQTLQQQSSPHSKYRACLVKLHMNGISKGGGNESLLLINLYICKTGIKPSAEKYFPWTGKSLSNAT